MTESIAAESSVQVRRTHPPKWSPALLGAALPVVVVLELASLVYAGGVFPLFDPTPLVVLVVAVLSRRWEGVSVKWFRVSGILAVLLLIQWIAWDVWYYFVVFEGSLSTYGFDQLVKRFGNPIVALILAQTIAMLFFFGRACVVSFKGVKRARSKG
jgi:hypothetical protein